MAALKKVLRRARKAARAAAERAGLVNRPARVLPNTIMIGAMKAGTSSLHAWMAQHPGVAACGKKEAHYFDLNFEKGLSWYRERFPTEREAAGRPVVLESTPYYMYHPHAARRIHAFSPDVRLIAVLRDPVARAISHYYHEVRLGCEPLGLMEALDAEESRVSGEEQKMLRDEGYVSFEHQHHSYQRRGHYIDQLRAYHDLFGREAMLILDARDVFKRPEWALCQVFEFLGVDAGFKAHDLGVWNKGKVTKGDDRAAAARLRAYYRRHNERLYEYLGRDYGW